MLRRSTVAILAALIAVPVVAASSATRAHATTPGSNGKIAFASDFDGRTEVYTVNADGTGVTQVTDGPGATSPSWSPDGSQFAYAAGFSGPGISIADADGRGSHQISTASTLQVAWSGDGSRVAYVGPGAAGNGTTDIFTANIDGSNVKDVVADATAPAWSPDGTKIVYSSGSDIYVANADGTNPTRLTTAGGEFPSFSPDGSKIVFGSIRDGDGGQIFVMNADGSNQFKVTTGTPQKRDPSWSPDGHAIVTEVFGANTYGLATVNADGSNFHTIVSNMGFVQDPAWQPIPQPKPPFNGKLLFSRGDNTTVGLYTANPDGSDLTNISANPEVAGVWSPDGSEIAYLGLDNGTAALMVRNADGTNPHVAAEPPLLDRFPAAWSPDGTKLAFMVKQSPQGDDDIWTVNADGTGATAVITDASFDLFPTWTSDGKLVYSRGQIVLANADGSNEIPLTNPPAGLVDLEPTVSPDGSHILFRRGANSSGSPSEAWIMNTDGSGQTMIATLPPNEGWMRYSPDGKQIVLARDAYPNTSAIVVMNVDGTGAHDVYSAAADLAYPSWAPLSEPVVPGLSSAPKALAGNGWATVVWTAPRYDGGVPVSTYRVTASPGGATVTVPGSQTSATVAGLTNSTAYTFTVEATNSVGVGPPSAPSNPVIPAAKFNGRIAFTRTVAGKDQVFTSAEDGTDVQQITNFPGGGALPTWSPDGTQLAIDGGPDPVGIYIINADGSNPKRVANPALFATWSPDGSRIALLRTAYASGNTVVPGIATAKADGTGETLLGSGIAPAWTPDSQRLLFLNNHELWAMNSDGTGRMPLGPQASNGALDVSPDGRRVVFMASDGVHVSDIDGSKDALVKATTGTWTKWSPDGTQIVFAEAGASPNTSAIEVMDTDGSNLHAITSGQTNDQFPDWQPLAQPGVPSPPSAVAATAGNASAVVHWTAPASAGSGSVTNYTVTSSPGGKAASVGGTSTQATVSGLTNGTAYTFTVHATNAYGDSIESAVSNSIKPRPDSRGGFVLDDWGGIHPFRTGALAPPAITVPGPYWPGQDVVRGIASVQSAGFVVDDWGGIHPYVSGTGVTVPPVHGGPYWPGQDVVRGIALMPGGTGGYVLDDWGGLHPFAVGTGAAPPQPLGGPYWAGIDAARGVTILPDGTGGYVVDSWGGLHPFVIPGPGHTMPAQPTNGPYWVGQNVVRGVAADAEGNGGYVVDDWGGVHSFSIPGTAGPVPAPSAGPYWPGLDAVRGISVVP